MFSPGAMAHEWCMDPPLMFNEGLVYALTKHIDLCPSVHFIYTLEYKVHILLLAYNSHTAFYCQESHDNVLFRIGTENVQKQWKKLLG